MANNKIMKSLEWHEQCYKNQLLHAEKTLAQGMDLIKQAHRSQFQAEEVRNRIARVRAAGKTEMEVK